jgi:predicted ATPase with chaperone activity
MPKASGAITAMNTKSPLFQLLKEPQSIDQMNMPPSILSDILLRLLYNEGNVSTKRINQVMRVPLVMDEMLDWLRKEKLIEISHSPMNTGSLSYTYKLTNQGIERAQMALDRCHYVGPPPIAVDIYQQVIELQTENTVQIPCEEMKAALTDMILPSDFHTYIGPAINSGTSILLYGPPGNGKTTIAQIVSELMGTLEPIWLPYALTFGGQIIQVYDRNFHISAEFPEDEGLPARIDGRWGYFNRPAVAVGGELRMEALDLHIDPTTKTYEAPIQLKANGGLLLIDDFGRQQIDPVQMLNRWIVPLESGVDYLRMQTGQAIEMPFRQLVIFSTNLDPYALGDDAFYRRIHMKIGVFSPNEERYRTIFMDMANHYGIPFSESVYAHLLNRWYSQEGRKMQAVHPRDLLKIVKALCEYDNAPLEMTPARIDKACECYFVDREQAINTDHYNLM